MAEPLGRGLRVLVPLYGFVRGDSMGVVVLVQDTDTVATLAHSLAEACQVRVAPFASARVWQGGQCLDPSLTIAACGLKPLQRVDLIPEGD